MEIDCIWFKQIIPNTECQLIVYERGAYGSFIFQLVSALYDETYPLNMFSNGSCHCGYVNLSKKSHHYIYQKNLKQQIYELADPQDETRPVILKQHKWPNHNIFFKRWPLGKIIYMTSTVEDQDRLMAYWLIKTRFVIEDNKDFKVLPGCQEKIKKGLKQKNSFLTFPEEQIPNDYPTQTFKIKCNDVIANKDLVLETLSVCTNRPITEKIDKFYSSYITMQEKLRQEYFPYINPI